MGVRERIRTITHQGDKSVELDTHGNVRSINVPAYRIPECYLTEVDSSGKQYLFPSPHTPLNWATAEALSAFSSMSQSFKFQNK